MTPEATAKTVQYLSEAHATELALTRTLQAHVAMTPRGSYRGLLERHLSETKAQASALEDRLSALGEGRSLFEATWEAALTLGQGILGQALALSKGPLDVLRGSGGEEKLLKNAKDECATEALEIATYDALEQLATRTGDTKTAEIARRHREQEERMLAELRELIPGLVDDVVRAELDGVPVYDASETPAGERAAAVTGGVRDVARDASSGARGAATTAQETAREVARDVSGTAREASTDTAGQPWSGYDGQSANEVVRRLARAPKGQVESVREYERAHKDRVSVLRAAERQLSGAAS